MGQLVRDIMTKDPISVSGKTPLADCAKKMKEANVGALLVTKDGGHICGVVTDRDITIRGVAEEQDPKRTPVEKICSGDVTTVSPDDEADKVIELMRKKAIRRVPVVKGDRPVGIVSIGDLAMQRDQRSALADISAAAPNR
ncbi:MAG TPA: CBS domain-containing protein [Polyangiaceae bacterium]|nr:CBS domain-containing protein [Polyangiaceae bacterium]